MRRTAANSSFDERELGRPAWAPACLVSLCVHAGIVLLLGLTSSAVQRGTDTVWVAANSIVLHTQAQPVEYYADEGQDAAAATFQVAAASPGTAAGLPDVLDEPAAVDPRSALPSEDDWAGIGSVESGTATGVQGLLGGGRSQGSTMPTGGKARTSVFGLSGVGYKFVYVFDRSGSMGGSGHSALHAAKAELKASLASLGEVHQFQIIFYNERPTIFPLAGRAGRLVFGNAPNKQHATRFIDNIIADGATRHEEALLAALKLAPDVIFFLTDADQPELTLSQLEKIRLRNNDRAVINTIEFGLGPAFEQENFLTKLSQQNGGQHIYFDVSKLNEQARGQRP